MKRMGFISLGFLFCVYSSIARIHETAAQCESRYGQPLEEHLIPLEWSLRNILFRVYVKDDVILRIGFIKNKAMVISYQNEKWTEVDPKIIDKLLELNSEGSSWTNWGGNFWHREDGQVSASATLFEDGMSVILEDTKTPTFHIPPKDSVNNDMPENNELNDF